MSDQDAVEPIEVAGGYRFEDLKVGMTAAFSKVISEADLVMFAGVSGDTNPVHFDEAYAQTTMFKGRIAHGMLSASLISTVLGTRLPGPGSIYMNQSLKFLKPVKIGSNVEARVTIEKLDPEKRRITCKTQCKVGDTVVVDGEAMMWLPA